MEHSEQKKKHNSYLKSTRPLPLPQTGQVSEPLDVQRNRSVPHSSVTCPSCVLWHLKCSEQQCSPLCGSSPSTFTVGRTTMCTCEYVSNYFLAPANHATVASSFQGVLRLPQGSIASKPSRCPLPGIKRRSSGPRVRLPTLCRYISGDVPLTICTPCDIRGRCYDSTSTESLGEVFTSTPRGHFASACFRKAGYGSPSCCGASCQSEIDLLCNSSRSGLFHLGSGVLTQRICR